ncbi:primosomal protein N' [Entomospira entomophila]|uniref:Replication restart protein PriA n=1 Tax=Entomospira entomophila TaxID=2719988 RepID=A0A968G8N8_9SPIO|nr:primosomal protein N' [Entomospira entomophilus]NIZ40608.1 primosomal protein N' [Entomospira entomophilus]WDI34823.1 primosomal protein N' [Entomospira entomophilus]
MMPSWIEVVFRHPLMQSFTYRVPSDQISIGMRVIAPFRSREQEGMTISVSSYAPSDKSYDIKDIIKVIDVKPLFEPAYLFFAQHVAEYNYCSLGEAIFAMIPSAKQEKEYDFTPEYVLNQVGQHVLNESQTRALQCIQEEDGWYYLFGHTGSGKTMVYFHAIEHVLQKGQQVIYLLPEIALLHSVESLLRERFGDTNVATLHSGLKPSVRMKQWRQILEHRISIVLGVRSAIFSPLANLGLIIIDEEHDTSYKSGSTPRYHARQVAMYRAKTGTGVTLIMGSATPSVEAYHAMEQKQIRRVDLSGFAGGGSRPQFHVIDMREEKTPNIFSKRLVQEVWKTKRLGQQSAIFINRRGYSRFYICKNCGYEAFCPHCSVSLTYHQVDDLLLCHYCGYTHQRITTCPSCGSLRGEFKSFGIELVEEEARRVFPELSIVRVDSDVAKVPAAAKKALSAFQRGEIDLLIGTQMIAKGFNFPHLRLVAIALADIGLALPDFRAMERLFGFLQQVAGRTGRYRDDGVILAQTYNPDQVALQYSLQNDTEGFLQYELHLRQETGFPPFSRIMRLVFRGAKEERVMKSAEQAFEYWESVLAGYESHLTVEMLGPSEAVLSKIAGKFRWQILFLTDNYALFSKIFRERITAMPQSSGIYCEVDHDPLTLL